LDITDEFPENIKNPKVLPYFIDWLMDNVDLIEIEPYSYEDAYTIFETMNDRGLILSPTDMLKGFLLANIHDDKIKSQANELWRSRTLELLGLSKNDEPDFFKAWLRAKYADSIRERKKGATNKDFENIATFHRWVREGKQGRKKIGLETDKEFRDLVFTQFDFFSKKYIKIRQATMKFTPQLESIFYNDLNDFTLQYPLTLACLKTDDDEATSDAKIRLASTYVDIFIARRIANSRTRGYSAVSYTIFNLLKEIRNLPVPELARVLKDNVTSMPDKFDGIRTLKLRQQNRKAIHYILARLTYHIEEESAMESSFESYVSPVIKKPFQIEHLWAEDKYREYASDFQTEQEFLEYRNKMGGLILLPEGFNQSFNADTYQEKVSHYFGQNLLARSLNPQCYQNNPSFMRCLQRTGLPFKAYPNNFSRSSLDSRTELYRLVREEIWSISRFDQEVENWRQKKAS
jgi:hypothetical protein